MIKKLKKLLNLSRKKCYNDKNCKKMERKKMYSALEVARYIVNYANNHDMIVSNLKLQKILYFVQMEFLIKFDSVCFKDDIEAWDFGPVVPEVYREFKKYGSLNIPKITSVFDYSNGIWDLKKVDYVSKIAMRDRPIINTVVNECNNYTPSQLVEITHNQSPWRDAYHRGGNNIISVESIKSFIRDVVGVDA